MTPTRLDVGDRLLAVVLEAAHGVVVVGFDQIDEVMPDLGPVGGGGLRRPDVHADVHLHRVDADEFDPGDSSGQLQRQRRLARGGGTDQCQMAPVHPAETGIRVR